MLSLTYAAIAGLASFLPTALAQTHSLCNPLNTTGCPDMPALGGNGTWLFNKTGIPEKGKIWYQTNQGDQGFDQVDGATFTVARSGDSPTAQSKFYMLFGRVEVVMKAAKGLGIVSSAILQSEALDEIDWEFLGQDGKRVYTNYFGKGNRTVGDRGHDYPISPSPQDAFHNYTIDWTKDRIQWILDDVIIRNQTFDQALGGKNYPQTPMNIRLGAWAAGDASKNSEGTVDWAGGHTDFSDGPFIMAVQSVYAQDYTTAKTYSWDGMDASGDWQKVKVITGGKSEILEEIESPSGVRNRWKALSHGAQIGIIAGSIGAFVLALCVLTFCCFKQRRAGRKEHAALLAQEDKEAAELQEYKRQMQGGRFGMGSGGYGRV